MFRKRDYVEEVRSNPNIYCNNVCRMTDCPKHKDKVDKSKLYLFAMLKDTPYCMDEDPETFGEYKGC